MQHKAAGQQTVVRQKFVQQKTASFLSLGCKVNQTELECMAELFREAGYAIVEPSMHPRVLIINTCAVTAVAEGKSRRLIRRVVRDYPESVVAVMGCFSQLAAGDVKALGAHVVIGTRERRSLLACVEKALRDTGIVDADEKAAGATGIAGAEGCDRAAVAGAGALLFEELPRLSQERRVRATVKIQDGCDQGCSYCIVPTVRGPSRSRQPESVLEEVQSLLGNGYKEIVLTGIHLGLYGRDSGWSLAELIERIAEVPGLGRLRLSSLESTEIVGGAGPVLLDVLAAHRDIVCPHFHIPLQSGSDRILARMGRPYSRTDFLGALDRIRGYFPDAAITTDLMAGFPGETDEDAEDTLCMVAECAFADVHAFGFSPRPGTPAAVMPEQIAPGVRAARVKALIEAGRESRAAYLKRFYGQTMEVLLESVGEGGARGHTRNYIAVTIPAPICSRLWRGGDLVDVRLTEQLIGESW